MTKRLVNREDKMMKELGLSPVNASGAFWLWKEDGENDDVIAQLKSSDGKAISVSRQDVLDLFHHARVSHKLPVFVLDFIGSFSLVCMRPSDMKELVGKIKTW